MTRRSSALIPLTHDHHHTLVHVRRLKPAAKGSDSDRCETAQRFIEFFQQETVQHFREEEDLVFPLVSDTQDLAGMIEQVLGEHVDIHALVNALQREMEHGIPSSETLSTVAETLERHVRLEEKVVFPRIEALVDPALLESIEISPKERKRPN